MPITIHNHLIDKLAVVAGIVSGVALYPQVWAITQSPSVEHYSVISFCIILVNSCGWLAYSVHRALLSLAIPSMFNILGASIVIVHALVATH